MTVVASRPAIVRTPLIRVADTVCVCGGLLVQRANRWVHVDACPECVGQAVCDECDEGHLYCLDPEPLACAHEADWGCVEPVALDDLCTRGRAGCCGCCNADYAHTREVM